MDDTDKIVAAILAASLCAQAGSADMDDYIVNYQEIADRLSSRKMPPVKAATKRSDKKGKRRA
jgi:hypothetical protein